MLTFVGLRISNCFSCLAARASVSSKGAMGDAHTARKREKSEARTRARLAILKYMMIVVRWALGVGVGVFN